MKKQRPVHLNLQTIRFPATAIASILHRVSGVIMFFAIGVLLWLLNLSLDSADSFAELQQCLTSPFAKFVLWGIVTALIYHLLAGIRHLIMDAGYWEEMSSGLLSAKVTFAVAAVLSASMGVWLW
ncbi:succinate dehydrogenase, cytochrome b556 subunit [Paraferrimonas sedimenticola]|uniref:Succinate dehydrogenase cytochrome b556 subunit n=1 Tax=Paraferrimonas sedimenticola TaxID=375674 RepID=A0AA37VSQ9_9GAMM|nr:succinate dehydrogenase, cytochrome b556 subunit [Paraferrimonas sedimenticola]